MSIIKLTTLEEPVTYICESSAGFTFFIELENFPSKKQIKFTKHHLKVFTQEEVDAIDELIEHYPRFSQKIRKADKAAAELLVKQHMASMGGAHKGPVTSQVITDSQKPLSERDAALSGMTPEQENELAIELEKDNNLLTTSLAANPVPSPEPVPPAKPKTSLKTFNKKAK